MSRDVRKDLDEWLNESRLDPELKAALLQPLSPTITPMVMASIDLQFGHKITEIIPDTLRGEAMFRLNQVRKAILAYVDNQLRGILPYAMFATNVAREELSRELRKTADRIDHVPEAKERIRALLAERHSQD